MNAASVRVEKLASAIADDLAERGWSARPDFVAPALVDALRADALGLLRQGAFRPGGVGRGAARAVREEVRGDLLFRLDPGAPSPPQAAYLEVLAGLRDGLNRDLYLGLRSAEAHYAVYPSGAFYVRHVDRFRDDDARAVSTVLYLVDAWSARDGGELVLHVERDGCEESVEILPEPGLLVCFPSGRVPHEVRVARRERLSLAAWLRTAPD